jgi:hypothetical protein
MYEIFVFGSFWFWALVAAEIVLLFTFVEFENGVGATISLVVFAGCLQWLGNVDIIRYVLEHPIYAAGGLLAYFSLGAVWACIKWWIYCHNLLEEYNDAKHEWLRDKGATDTSVVPEDWRREWSDYVYRNFPKLRKLPPIVREHKARIMRWMALWVISMVWSLINDFLKGIWKAIYRNIAMSLQAIADKVFAHMRDELQGR